MSDKPHFCGPCLVEKGEIEGVVYCRECEEPLCGQCKKDHARIKVSKHHKLCDLADVPPQEILDLLKSLIACPNHEKEEVVYLCKDHDTACCSKCAMADHRKCEEVKVLSDILHGIQLDCIGLKTVLHDLKQQGESLLEHECKHAQLVSEIESQALSALQTIKQKLFDMYAQLENEVLSAIADKRKEITQTIQTNKEQTLNFLNDIKQQSVFIEQVEKFGTNEHVVLLQRLLEKDALCRLKSTVGELKHNRSTSSFKCVEDTSFDGLLIEMKNSLQIEDVICDVSEAGSEIDNDYTKPYTERVPQLQSSKDLNIIPMFDKAKCPQPRSCVWIDTYIVIALHEVNAVLVMKDNSDFVTSKFNCDSTPWTVSKTGPTEMVITLPHAGNIVFAKLRDGNVHVVTKLKTRVPYFDVSRNAPLNQYICISTTNGQIDILNNDGTLLREISISSDIKEFVKSEFSLCNFNSYSRLLIISNSTSNKLMALNLNGLIAFVYTHLGLIFPCQIAVDPNGNVYVTTYDNSIHQISPSGQYIRSLRLREETQTPLGVCFNSTFDKIALSGVELLRDRKFGNPYMQVFTFT